MRTVTTVLTLALTGVLAAACAAGDADGPSGQPPTAADAAGGDDGHGHGPVVLLTPPSTPPPDPGARLDLLGFHEGRMELPRVGEVRYEPDAGVFEVRFTSDDGGSLFLRSTELEGGLPVSITVSLEVAEHVSATNKTARRYLASEGECEVVLTEPLAPGAGVAGTLACNHLRGQVGSSIDATGGFRAEPPVAGAGAASDAP